MSGGEFDYAYSRVETFSRDLRDKLETETQLIESEQVRAALSELVWLAALTADLMRHAEWLYSGDIGEETFMSRCAESAVKHQHALAIKLPVLDQQEGPA